MADERRGIAWNPDALADVLAKLDDVMAEAERLRRQVSRQLAEQRSEQQQRITDPSRRRRPPRKKS